MAWAISLWKRRASLHSRAIFPESEQDSQPLTYFLQQKDYTINCMELVPAVAEAVC